MPVTLFAAELIQPCRFVYSEADRVRPATGETPAAGISQRGGPVASGQYVLVHIIGESAQLELGADCEALETLRPDSAGRAVPDAERFAAQAMMSGRRGEIIQAVMVRTISHRPPTTDAEIHADWLEEKGEAAAGEKLRRFNG